VPLLGVKTWVPLAAMNSRVPVLMLMVDSPVKSAFPVEIRKVLVPNVRVPPEVVTEFMAWEKPLLRLKVPALMVRVPPSIMLDAMVVVPVPLWWMDGHE